MLPTPRYQIGDTVWKASISHAVERLPCPDCLGAGKWKVTTPAGTELETACLRCTGRQTLRTPGGEDIPSLNVVKWEPSTKSLTIGSIRIDTACVQDPVEYMCVETGIGSGSIYRERSLYSSREEALEVARIEAASKTEKDRAQPEQIKALRLGDLTVKLAGRMADWDSVYNAWDVARWHRETLDNITDGDPKPATLEAAVEWIGERAAELRRYDFIDRHPFEELLRVARESADPAVRAVAEKIDHKFPSGD